MKKIILFMVAVFGLVIFTGCGNNEAEERAAEIWAALDETSWIEYLPSCGDVTIIMLSFHYSETTGRSGTFGMGTGENPTIATVNVRLYTEDQPSRITIFGTDVHGEEVHFYYNEPVTIRGDELHIGDATYFRNGTNAADDRMHESIIESFSCS